MNCFKDIRNVQKYTEPLKLNIVQVRFIKTVKGLEGLLYYLNDDLKGGKKLEVNLQISEEVNLFKVFIKYKKFTLF